MGRVILWEEALMPLTDKQRQRVEGIVSHVNEMLTKRFALAARINPKLKNIESDIKWHQMETLRRILSNAKGFGPVKILVADILCSADEKKKRALFTPSDQVTVMNEIITSDDDTTKTAMGGAEIRNLKDLYSALDPSLETVLLLVQTWVWWDLRDASDQYRFEIQEERLQILRTKEVDDAMKEFYRKEMELSPGANITQDGVLRFELQRTKDIVEHYRQTRNAENGYQVIVVSEEMAGNMECDIATVQLAQRLKLIEKLEKDKDKLEPELLKKYAARMSTRVEQLTAEAVIEFEKMHANQERMQLYEKLAQGGTLRKTNNFKLLKLEEMQSRYEILEGLLDLKDPEESESGHFMGDDE